MAQQANNSSVARLSTNSNSRSKSTPDEIIVVPRAGLDSDHLEQSLSEVHGSIINTINSGLITAYLVRVDRSTIEETCSKLKKDKNFTSVQRNLNAKVRRAPLFTVPNDPSYSSQYQMAQLNVPPTWAMRLTGRGIRIGIIDTGVLGTQIDLVPRVEIGYNAVTNQIGGNRDFAGKNHGTAVATTLAASTDNGLLGASPAFLSSIVPVNVFDTNGDVSDFSMISAMNWLYLQGVRLVNGSLGNDEAPWTNPALHPALFRLLQLLQTRRAFL